MPTLGAVAYPERDGLYPAQMTQIASLIHSTLSGLTGNDDLDVIKILLDLDLETSATNAVNLSDLTEMENGLYLRICPGTVGKFHIYCIEINNNSIKIHENIPAHQFSQNHSDRRLQQVLNTLNEQGQVIGRTVPYRPGAGLSLVIALCTEYLANEPHCIASDFMPEVEGTSARRVTYSVIRHSSSTDRTSSPSSINGYGSTAQPTMFGASRAPDQTSTSIKTSLLDKKEDEKVITCCCFSFRSPW